MSELVASLNVGKTHSRLALIDSRDATVVWSTRRSNASVDTPIGRQLDIAGIEHWLIDALSGSPHRDRIAAVVPIAHGATAMLLDSRGQLLAAPDYEDARFERVNEEYAAERDPFDQTCSPPLPLGLNLGRQLFYLERHEPRLFGEARHFLLHPQFWAWRLTGIMASEITSLGCHSDLWLPHGQKFSAVARRHGWDARFPPMRFAGDTLGFARGAFAEAAGLPAACRVSCGIHDSNASYLRYLLGHREERFAVISSGTWTVIMANKAPLERLRSDCDMLANIDAFGSPVATARFMGGREYQAIARTDEIPTLDALKSVIEKGAIAVPAFAPGGPFATSPGQLINIEMLDGAERAALASLYVALMSDLALDLLAADGDVIVDGPLAANPLFAPVLAGLRPRNRVLVDDGRSDSIASCHLAGFAQGSPKPCPVTQPVESALLARYAALWRQHAAALRRD